jgi:hypothetical protein
LFEPAPPPVEVIVENAESLPFTPTTPPVFPETVTSAPPPPTVTVIGVLDVTAKPDAVLYPPAPPPPLPYPVPFVAPEPAAM